MSLHTSTICDVEFGNLYLLTYSINSFLYQKLNNCNALLKLKNIKPSKNLANVNRNNRYHQQQSPQAFAGPGTPAAYTGTQGKMEPAGATDWAAKYKGAMTKQPLSDIDNQLK